MTIKEMVADVNKLMGKADALNAEQVESQALHPEPQFRVDFTQIRIALNQAFVHYKSSDSSVEYALCIVVDAHELLPADMGLVNINRLTPGRVEHHPPRRAGAHGPGRRYRAAGGLSHDEPGPLCGWGALGACLPRKGAAGERRGAAAGGGFAGRRNPSPGCWPAWGCRSKPPKRCAVLALPEARAAFFTAAAAWGLPRTARGCALRRPGAPNGGGACAGNRAPCRCGKPSFERGIPGSPLFSALSSFTFNTAGGSCP